MDLTDYLTAFDRRDRQTHEGGTAESLLDHPGTEVHRTELDG